MATKIKHIDYVQTILNKGAKADDHRIPNSIISHTLDFVRSLLITRELDKHKNISDFSYQTLCLSLSETNPTICSISVTLPDNCTLLRSTTKIPTPINSSWGSLIKVQYLDGRQIGRMSLQQSKRAKYSESLSSVVSYFIQDDYLYLIGTKNLSKVQIQGIWENPTEAEITDTCGTLTDEYPIDAHLVGPMYELTVQNINISNSFQEDTQNNATDIEIQTK